MSREKDKELVERCQRGEWGAFDEVFHQHKHQMYRLARAILRYDQYDEQAVEDVVQDAFVRIITRIDKYRGDCALSTWITAIVANLARDAIRRRSIRQHSPLEVVDWFTRPSRPMAEQFVEINQRRRIWAAVQQLDDAYRMPLILHYYERLSCDDVADVLGIKTSVVYSRLHAARKRLPALVDAVEATPTIEFPYA